MNLKKIFRIVILVCLILVIIDQASKILVNNLITKDISIIPNDFLTITKVENEGVAFGINKQNLGNIGLCLIVLIVIFNYLIAQKDRMNVKTVIFLSFIIAGGLSNVIDRIFKGFVFDFIKIGDFPVFNIADVFIVLGWALFLIKFLKEMAIDFKAEFPVKKDKK